MKQNYFAYLFIGILLPAFIAATSCSQTPAGPAAKTSTETTSPVSLKDAANDPRKTFVKPSKEELKKEAHTDAIQSDSGKRHGATVQE